jgi:hypothetical protein
MREINNLKIALQAISERYSDDSNKDFFQLYIEKQKTASITEEAILKEINFIRRKHHYNFLSMNEIFTLPPLEVDDKERKSYFLNWIVNKIYWFPLIIYVLILLNDILTFDIGWKLHPINTSIGLLIAFICLVALKILCKRCANQKKIINNLYSTFKERGYRYDRSFELSEEPV